MGSAKPTPRLIFVRHGQTEWSKSGQYTSVTDLDLTPYGVKQMLNTGKDLIGSDRHQFIKPENLKLIITSPRLRAQRTAQLLLESLSPEQKEKIPIETDQDIREWEYGDYEGLLTSQIQQLRASRGLDANLPAGEKWNIWRDGCENGENYLQVTERVDAVIAKVKSIHRKAFETGESSDILIIAHGHILRCLAARWLGRDINCNPQLMLDAGGVGVLSYQHNNIEEPALVLAGAFEVPTEDED